MLYLKDVETEIRDAIKKALRKGKKQDPCPKCGGSLKREGFLKHYIKVACSKIASSEIGGAVPAPDYDYTCEECDRKYLYVDNWYIPIKKTATEELVSSLKNAFKKSNRGGN